MERLRRLPSLRHPGRSGVPPFSHASPRCSMHRRLRIGAISGESVVHGEWQSPNTATSPQGQWPSSPVGWRCAASQGGSGRPAVVRLFMRVKQTSSVRCGRRPFAFHAGAGSVQRGRKQLRLTGLRETSRRTGVWPDSVQALGGTLDSGLPERRAFALRDRSVEQGRRSTSSSGSEPTGCPQTTCRLHHRTAPSTYCASRSASSTGLASVAQ